MREQNFLLIPVRLTSLCNFVNQVLAVFELSKSRSKVANITKMRYIVTIPILGAFMPKTSDALEILHRRFLKDKPESQELLREISLNARVAQLIYTVRKQKGLTQKQLAYSP